MEVSKGESWMCSFRSEGRRRPVLLMLSRDCLIDRINPGRSRFHRSSRFCGVSYRRSPLRPISYVRCCASWRPSVWVRAGSFTRKFPLPRRRPQLAGHRLAPTPPGLCAGTSDRTRTGQEQPANVRRGRNTSISSITALPAPSLSLASESCLSKKGQSTT
jgi:hypothetical protein